MSAKYYEEERKNRYLDYRRENGQRVNDRTFFSVTVRTEEEKGKDICEFTKDEILDFYKSVLSTSVEYLLNMTSFLNQYTDWTIMESINPDGINHYKEIELENLNNCINRQAIDNSFISREMLNMFVDNWHNGRYDCMNGCDLSIIYLLFEGIGGKRYEDILNITFNNVDYKKKTVTILNGTEITVSDKCLELLKEASKDEKYYLPDGREFNFLDDKIVRSYRKDQVSYDTVNPVSRIHTLRDRVEKVLNNLGIMNVTLKGIQSWGQVDYVKELIRLNKITPDNIREFVLSPECEKEFKVRFDKKNVVMNRFYEKYKEYL